MTKRNHSLLYYARKESFGAVLYNTHSTEYFFITNKQLNILLGNLTCLTNDNECDYSNGQFKKLLKMIKESKAKINWKQGLSPLPLQSLSAPIRIYFEITRRCNLNCKYCLNNSGNASENPLNTEEMLATIDNLANEGVFEIRLTGGEITQYPDYEILANRVKSNDLALTLNTNLICTQKTLGTIIELNPAMIITSLDASKIAHTKNRGKGYELVVSNIKTLLEHGHYVRINCVITNDSIPYFESFIDKFAPLGCGFCFILPRPSGRAISSNWICPDINRLKYVDELIDRKSKQYPNNCFFSSFSSSVFKTLVIGDVELTGCSAMQKSFNINSDGSVFPCAFFEIDPQQFRIGNIRNTGYSIIDLWRNSKLLQKLRASSGYINKKCSKCSNFHKDCMGTCVFMTAYEEITKKPNPYCQKSLSSCEGK